MVSAKSEEAIMIRTKAAAAAFAAVATLAFQSPVGAADSTPGKTAAPVVHSGSAGAGSSQFAPVPSTHRCHNFGFIPPVTGHRAGECASIDLFTNSAGAPAIRALGQSFCQRESDAVVVQCAAIIQTIHLYDGTTSRSYPEATFICGARLHYPPCPAGRFQNVTPGQYRFCNHVYSALVSTILYLPETSRVEEYEDWYSGSFRATTPCIV